MKVAAHPLREAERLQGLQALYILDTEAEPLWDQIAYLAAAICRTPIALVTFIDEDRQWFKARVGLDVQETSRDVSFCAHAILDDELFIVRDTSKDARFRDNPLVTGEPRIQFYAGAPLEDADGNRLGTLCVIDREPRRLSQEQKRSLEVLRDQAEGLLRMRATAIALQGLLQGPSSQDAINRVAHELNTPLTPILMSLALLRDDLADEPKMLAHVERVERNVDRLRAVVQSAVDSLF